MSAIFVWGLIGALDPGVHRAEVGGEHRCITACLNHRSMRVDLRAGRRLRCGSRCRLWRRGCLLGSCRLRRARRLISNRGGTGRVLIDRQRLAGFGLALGVTGRPRQIVGGDYLDGNRRRLALQHVVARALVECRTGKAFDEQKSERQMQSERDQQARQLQLTQLQPDVPVECRECVGAFGRPRGILRAALATISHGSCLRQGCVLATRPHHCRETCTDDHGSHRPACAACMRISAARASASKPISISPGRSTATASPRRHRSSCCARGGGAPSRRRRRPETNGVGQRDHRCHADTEAVRPRLLSPLRTAPCRRQHFGIRRLQRLPVLRRQAAQRWRDRDAIRSGRHHRPDIDQGRRLGHDAAGGREGASIRARQSADRRRQLRPRQRRLQPRRRHDPHCTGNRFAQQSERRAMQLRPNHHLRQHAAW